MSGRYLADVEKHKTVKAEASPALKEPRKYKVFLINDDYTPMEFVVDLLNKFFQLSDEIAIQVMLRVHLNGRGVCGIYTRDIAETKVILVNDYARLNEHPLKCCMDPE